MSDKTIMYEKKFDGFGCKRLEKVEPTGKCKRLTVTTNGDEKDL